MMMAQQPPLTVERKHYDYTVDCDERHKRPSPEEAAASGTGEGEGDEELKERPRKRLRVHPGETDSEDDDGGRIRPLAQAGDVDFDQDQGGTMPKATIEDNIARLSRLIEPLEKIRHDTTAFGDLLHQQDTCFVNDFSPLVTKIGHGLDELHQQLAECRSFYTFLLHARRPVQAEWGYFGMLPPELLLKVFSFLESGRDLAVAQCVCTFFHKVGSDSSLWKALCLLSWPQDIRLSQKPPHKSWRWLFDCKMVPSSSCPRSLIQISSDEEPSYD